MDAVGVRMEGRIVRLSTAPDGKYSALLTLTLVVPIEAVDDLGDVLSDMGSPDTTMVTLVYAGEEEDPVDLSVWREAFDED